MLNAPSGRVAAGGGTGGGAIAIGAVRARGAVGIAGALPKTAIRAVEGLAPAPTAAIGAVTPWAT